MTTNLIPTTANILNVYATPEDAQKLADRLSDITR